MFVAFAASKESGGGPCGCSSLSSAIRIQWHEVRNIPHRCCRSEISSRVDWIIWHIDFSRTCVYHLSQRILQEIIRKCLPWIFLRWNARKLFIIFPNISQSLGLWHVLIYFICTQIAHLKMMLNLHPIDLILMCYVSLISHWFWCSWHFFPEDPQDLW